jgi:hypothetical protein
MAEMALEEAEHEVIHTLAQAIISAQNAEIEQMQIWLTEWYPDATESSTPEAAAATTSHPDHPLVATPHSVTAGAVTVEVVPLVDDEILDIAFAVSLETHSVDLNFDLAEQATLTIGDAEFADASWEPDAPSGHHVTGTLLFTIDHPAHAALGELDEVTLDLGEIDGQPVTLTFAVE